MNRGLCVLAVFSMVLSLAVSSWADTGLGTINLGYGTFTGVYHYPQTNLTTGVTKNQSENISTSQLTFEADLLAKLADSLYGGIEIGIDTPLSSYSFDLTKYGINPLPGNMPGFNVAGAGWVGTGSTASVKLTTMPILAKAEWVSNVGPGSFSLGVGVGPLLLLIQSEEVLDVYPSKSNATLSEVVTADNYSVFTVFDTVVTPGYGISLGANDTLSLQVPLSFTSTASQFTKINSSTPNPGDDNPQYAPLTSGGSTDFGGFVWGVSLACMHKF